MGLGERVNKIWNDFKLGLAKGLVYGAGIGVLGCGGDGGGGPGRQVEIPPTTKILDAPSSTVLVSDESGTLTFSGNTEQLDSLMPGDAYVSDVNSITPNGFIRKVISTNPDSGNVIVGTIPATLEDAIKSGWVNISRDITSADVKSKTLAKGVVSSKPSKSWEFSLNLDNTILYDADGDEVGTTNDQIIANGYISLNFGYDFDFDIDDWKLKQLNLVNRTTEDAQIQLDARVSVLDIHKKKEIAKYYLKSFTATIGPFPVVVVPILTVNVGFDGEISAGVTTDVTQQATINAGLFYNGQWSHTQSFTNTFQFNPPIISQFNAFAKAYAGPHLDLLLYGIAGPQGEINGYTQLEAGVNVDPWFILYGGLEALLGVKVDILGKSLVDHSETVLDYKKILAQSGASHGGKLIFASERDGDSEIYMINADGSNLRKLTNINTGGDYAPIWSPDGNKIAFESNRLGNSEVYTMNSDGTNQVNLTIRFEDDSEPAWSPNGSKMLFRSYISSGNQEVFVMNSDGTGQTRLTYTSSAWDIIPKWSPNGNKIAFISNRSGSHWELYTMDPDGSNQQNLADCGLSYAWSPNGNKIAFSTSSSSQICVIDADGLNQQYLANDGYSPVWSPNGNKIAFVSGRDGNDEIYIMNADGTEQINLTNNPNDDFNPVWSPDGTKLAFVSLRDSNREIYTINISGAGLLKLTDDPARDTLSDWYR